MDPLEDVLSSGVVSATPYGGYTETLYADEIVGTGQVDPGIGSTAEVTGTLSEEWTDTSLVVLVATGAVAASITTQTTSYPALYNLASGGERTFISVGSTLVDTGVLSETVSEEGQFLLTSLGKVADVASNSVNALGTLLSQGALDDLVEDYKYALLSASGAASDTAFISALVLRTVSDAGALSETVSFAAGSEGQLIDYGVVASSLLPVVNVLVFLEASADGYAEALASGNSAWTAHADSWAATRYAPYDFTSVTAWAGKLYAAGPQGLVELEGATDSGTAIDAYVRSYLTDFGDKRLKIPRALYIGYQAEQPLTVKMSATDSGVETEYEYSAPARLAETVVPDRVRLGRGLRSRYVRYTLMNESGGDFSVDDVFVDADLSERRI